MKGKRICNGLVTNIVPDISAAFSIRAPFLVMYMNALSLAVSWSDMLSAITDPAMWLIIGALLILGLIGICLYALSELP